MSLNRLLSALNHFPELLFREMVNNVVYLKNKVISVFSAKMIHIILT